MEKFTKVSGVIIALLFFVLGFYLLFADKFKYLPKEVRVIFAIFLFLYGAFRIVRYLFKDREKGDD